MAEQTGIQWTDCTQNWWTGCLRVSAGCDRCYAATFAKRNSTTFGGWEPGASRKRTSPANWRKPFVWNRAAERAGVRRRVFCSSMADFFDNQAPPEWRAEAWEVIRATPALDWQLLTKRPQNIARMLPPNWGDGWPNVWLGATAENQGELNRRAPILRRVPAVVRFLSVEPMLSFVDISAGSPGISWCIIGGESGGGARPMHAEWAYDLLGQCRAAGIAPFFKQVGSNRGPDWPAGITGKGDDPAQWPEWCRVQRFPNNPTPSTPKAVAADLFAEASHAG